MKKSESGKGDAYRPVDKKKYDETYVKVFGEKALNLWPRDKNGNLKGD